MSQKNQLGQDTQPSESSGSPEYVPLAVYSHYSLQKAFTKPEQLAARCKELGIKQVALTDINSISGVIKTYKALKKADIKLIYGIHLKKDSYNFVLLARNLAGWQELLSIGNYGVNPEKRYENVTAIVNLNDEAGTLFEDLRLRMRELYKCIPNLFYGCVDKSTCESLYEKVVKSGKTVIPLTDVYYAKPADSNKLQIMLCALHKATMKNYQDKMQPEHLRFFSNQSFHLKSYDEMLEFGFTEDELKTTVDLGSEHECFSLLKRPSLPKFPDVENESEALKELCRKGWKKLIAPKFTNTGSKLYQEYVDRVKYELGILDEFDFPGYFLITQDFVNAARKRGDMIGFARGSGGGCIVSYLVGNTQIDPVEYKLPFSRFINKGRLSGDNFSFPDLDIDFPQATRKLTIEYIKQKYGRDRVCQICTFSSLQGKSALREVLRIKGELDQGQITNITELIPDRAKLSDVLEEIAREGGVPSTILWALEHTPEKFTDWCKLKGDGTLEGELAEDFAIAIELEGTYKSYSKHASGLVISPVPLDTICILFTDKKNNNETISSFEMKDLESCGLVKFDILGTAVLDKIMLTRKLVQFGDVEDEDIDFEDDDSGEE